MHLRIHPKFPDPHPNLTCTEVLSRSLSCLQLWHTNICVPSCFPTLNSTAFMTQPSTEPSQPVSVPTYLCCCIVYYFLCGQITFVPHQQLVDVFTGIAVYLLQPLFYIIERLLGDKRAVSKTPATREVQHYSAITGKKGKAMYFSNSVLHNYKGQNTTNAAVFYPYHRSQFPPDKGVTTGSRPFFRPLLQALHNQPLPP